MRSQVTHLAGSRRAIRLLRFRPWRERGQRQGQHRNRLAVDHAGVVLSVQEFPQPGLSPRPLAAHAAYHARLLARARRIVVDPDLAEDVVQEAFLRAWRACGSFDPAGGPMVNWLLVITARTAIDMGKARVRRPPLASVPADANTPADGLSDIDRLILRSELRDALSSIDALHRDAVVETVLRDRPYAEVAAELGVPPGTVRTRVHYGLRRLRGVLETAA